ncbi:DUF2157 domain-containing protein [Hymenobacter busanensis]|uniref:DUF2157 domain-containing protein n=1 Tax=Hymenobacter busanensis TaxID=2607656 RepID=A0A7L4ZZC7_9BACT|nr:DUF2157 domain-containing protein [Hymenobacter busanensis]KAA9333188.1 DUF2157 domain-containing protein [Hymenobacter busanensis]QHJ08135.1 DUF2157 domain-containing protein [Hymenobacter busanensis]
MSQKFLETEGPGWVEQGIISAEQLQQLRALYPEQPRAIGLLPLLGSLLVGLSALSLIAANWQALPEWLRLAVLIGALVAAYAASEYFLRHGQRSLGTGLAGLGLILFGAGIVLTSQMYQLVGYDVTGLLAWVVAGVLLTYLYRSRFLLLLAVAIGALAQGYSYAELSTYSYATLVLTAAGLGYYWWRRPDSLCGAVLACGLLWQAGLLIGYLHIKITWFFVPAMLVYAAGDWQPNRPAARALQAPPLVAGFLFMLGLAMFGEAGSYTDMLRPHLAAYLGALLLVFGLSVAGKRARGHFSSATDWLLLLPGFYFPGGLPLAIAALVVLYAYSGAVLWRGNYEQSADRINLGTALFVLTTMVAYFKLTWEFLDKSLFFLLGGVLLLGLSWYLRRRAVRTLPPSDQR